MEKELQGRQAMLEAAQRGRITTAHKAKERRREYAENPKQCRHCVSPIDYDKRRNDFCSRSCAACCNNKGIAHNGVRHEFHNCKICETPHDNLTFCSAKCAGRFRSMQKDLEVEALLSGNIIETKLKPLTIKKYLLSLRGHFCESCQSEEWLGKPIPLVLDHINGNAEDWRSDNLRLVCGNCDMLSPTYCGRNRGNGRAWRRQRYAEGKSY